MKHIEIYHPDKYSTPAYTKVEENIYKGENPYGYSGEDMYFTSLAFEQEPELGEGDSPANISQYPLEGILDMFRVCVTDFYDELNHQSAGTCYQEFGGSDVERIRALLGIVGKHVYEKKFMADDLDEEEQKACEGMSEEELEEEEYVFYETVVE